MSTQVSDLNVLHNIPLPAPALLSHEIPRSAEEAEFVSRTREEIQKILSGEDDRFLLIAGPCSIHDLDAGMEYARRLAELQSRVEDRIKILMRVYFEKPRTTVGWKGLIMDPDLDGTAEIRKGLRTARNLLRDIIDLGVGTATEFLDPITPQYIADLICWAAIGARTTESQTHRQMASGLSMPVGFKNTTTGDILPAVNAVKAATQPQTFLGVSPEGVASEVSTRGNPHCHIILRGGEDGPNFSAGDVEKTIALLEKAGLATQLMIDASHANCGKKYTEMPAVFEEIIRQRASGNLSVCSAMLESNIEAGNQKIPEDKSQLVYGKSVTDECIDWETTVRLVEDAAKKLA